VDSGHLFVAIRLAFAEEPQKHEAEDAL
jgi:hypothetical protein